MRVICIKSNQYTGGYAQWPNLEVGRWYDLVSSDEHNYVIKRISMQVDPVVVRFNPVITHVYTTIHPIECFITESEWHIKNREQRIDQILGE